MVVGSLGDLLLQPRPLSPPELLLLLDGVTGPVSDDERNEYRDPESRRLDRRGTVDRSSGR